jgi:hypothetical protein
VIRLTLVGGLPCRACDSVRRYFVRNERYTGNRYTSSTIVFGGDLRDFVVNSDIYSRHKLSVVSVGECCLGLGRPYRLSTVWRAVAVVIALRVWLVCPAGNDHIVD